LLKLITQDLTPAGVQFNFFSIAHFHLAVLFQLKTPTSECR